MRLIYNQKHLKGNHKHFCKGLKNVNKSEEISEETSEEIPEEKPPETLLKRQISINDNHRVLTVDTPPGLPVKGRYDNIIKNMF